LNEKIEHPICSSLKRQRLKILEVKIPSNIKYQYSLFLNDKIEHPIRIEDLGF
jgi:hypothetical protein